MAYLHKAKVMQYYWPTATAFSVFCTCQTVRSPTLLVTPVTYDKKGKNKTTFYLTKVNHFKHLQLSTPSHYPITHPQQQNDLGQ